MTDISIVPQELPREGCFEIAEHALVATPEPPSVTKARVQAVCEELMRRGYTVWHWFSHEDMTYRWKFRK